MEGRLPVVAVWKATWLPTSQTFVHNQVSALRRWQPLLIGVRRLADGLPVTPDYAPFGRSLTWRLVHKASAATGYRGIYDGRLRRTGARLVHAHFGTSAVSVLPVARRLGLPLVVTFHGYDVTSETLRGDAGSAQYVRRLADVFAYADTLLAVSEFVASQLVRLGAPEHKIRVHYIGMPVNLEVPDPGRRSGVAFVGRLVDVKGVGDLIAALGMLPAALRAGLPVTIVGSGPLLEDLRRQAAEAGVEVDFTGYLSPDEVAGVLSRSAVFCGPSKTSPQGDTGGLWDGIPRGGPARAARGRLPARRRERSGPGRPYRAARARGRRARAGCAPTAPARVPADGGRARRSRPGPGADGLRRGAPDQAPRGRVRRGRGPRGRLSRHVRHFRNIRGHQSLTT